MHSRNSRGTEDLICNKVPKKITKVPTKITTKYFRGG